MSQGARSRARPLLAEPELLGRLAQALGPHRDRGTILDELLDLFLELAEVDSGGVLLVVGERFELAAERGWEGADPRPVARALVPHERPGATWAELACRDLSPWSGGRDARLVGRISIGCEGRLAGAVLLTDRRGRTLDGDEELRERLEFLGRASAGVFARLGETRLQRLEWERLDFVLSASDLGLWDWNVLSGEVVYNERFWSMLGYVPGELPSTITTWRELLHPDDRVAAIETLQRHLAGDTPRFEMQYRLRSKSGEWVWVQDCGQVVERDPELGAVRASGTHRDITARKRAEEEVARAHASLAEERNIFLRGQVVVFKWVNAEGWPVEYVSPNVRDVLGYPAEDWLSGRVKYAEIVHPDDLARVAREVADATGGEGESFTHEDYRIRRRDGRTIWLYDHTTMLRDAEGHVTHYLGYVFDVSQRREVERNRVALERKLQQAQKLEGLGVLAGGLAHDFNNLLVGILGNADLAREELGEGTPAAESVRYIEVAARRASDLVRQMLAYSGRASFVVEHLSLAGVVEEMTHLLHAAISKKALLEFEFEEEAPLVEGDATQVRQIVMNLITNASEALGAGGGTIRIRTGTQHCDRAWLASSYLDDNQPEGRYGFLEIADTGCGMDRETVSKIFDPFFTTKFSGRGLGLAAVLGIVRAHRGALKVDSRPGEGTVFRVLFPALDREARAPDAPSSEEELCLSGSRVLLVDDEPTVTRVTARMIAKLGADVDVADNGIDALERFRTAPGGYDLVVLDLTMPMMDGEECLGELRALDPDLPVVLMSGYSRQEVATRLAGSGRLVFLQKPFDGRTLALRIGEVLAR